MSASANEGALVAFGEQVLSLLDEARYSTSYKHALLLGLIDTLRARTGPTGQTATELPVSAVADRVLELYWPQTFPFAARGGSRLLRQSNSGTAHIITLILQFRQAENILPRTPIEVAKRCPTFGSLVYETEWVLANMPLPRLQNPYPDFIYEIDWDATTPRGKYFRDSTRSITFIGDAADHLVAIAGLLRPLIQRLWAKLVAGWNPTLVEDTILDRFLFRCRAPATTPTPHPNAGSPRRPLLLLPREAQQAARRPLPSMVADRRRRARQPRGQLRALQHRQGGAATRCPVPQTLGGATLPGIGPLRRVGGHIRRGELAKGPRPNTRMGTCPIPHGQQRPAGLVRPRTPRHAGRSYAPKRSRSGSGFRTPSGTRSTTGTHSTSEPPARSGTL
jgi:hypothetical protein